VENLKLPKPISLQDFNGSSNNNNITSTRNRMPSHNRSRLRLHCLRFSNLFDVGVPVEEQGRPTLRGLGGGAATAAAWLQKMAQIKISSWYETFLG
jgi:hypothetical protein